MSQNYTTIVPEDTGFAHTSATANIAAGSVLAANPKRTYLNIQNTHATGTAYINLAGGTASATNGMHIAPGRDLPFPQGGAIPRVAINAAASIDGVTLVITEA